MSKQNIRNKSRAAKFASVRIKGKVPKVTRKCHPEVKPKDLVNEKEILRSLRGACPRAKRRV